MKPEMIAPSPADMANHLSKVEFLANELPGRVVVSNLVARPAGVAEAVSIHRGVWEILGFNVGIEFEAPAKGVKRPELLSPIEYLHGVSARLSKSSTKCLAVVVLTWSERCTAADLKPYIESCPKTAIVALSGPFVNAKEELAARANAAERSAPVVFVPMLMRGFAGLGLGLRLGVPAWHDALGVIRRRKLIRDLEAEGDLSDLCETLKKQCSEQIKAMDGKLLFCAAGIAVSEKNPRSDAASQAIHEYELAVQNLVRAVDEDSDDSKFEAHSPKSCNKCHGKEYEQWGRSPHGTALHTLSRIGRARDPKCVSCHITGDTRAFLAGNDARQKELAHVQCNACHAQTGVHEFARVTQETCVRCHNLANSPSFNFENYRNRIACNRHD